MAASLDEMLGVMVLGRYRIVARLAKGGMGVVYLARAEGAAGFAKPVVVKRVLPDLTGDERMARLFIREAKILSNLQHPNIVGVIDFGEEDGAYIMILEYVRAYHLGLWSSHRAEQSAGKDSELLPVEGVVHIMIKVLDALEYAHGLTGPDGEPLEIVHADISPANILVDHEGQVKLLDFGIARMRGEKTQTTDSKSIRGKFSYLPVEALDGSPPTTSTDVYACGVTLYELLAGENPYTGSDETRTLARVISHEPPKIGTVRPGVSPELEAIVHRAMSKDKASRFESAKAFAQELRRVQKLPEDEAARALAVVAKADFVAMGERGRAGPSLATLESAWRNPSAQLLAVAVSEPRLRAALGEAPTQIVDAASMPASSRAAKVGKSRVGLFVALGLAAMVVLGGVIATIVVVVLRRDDAAKVVVIERSGNSDNAPTATVTSSAPTPHIEEDAAAVAAAGTSPPPVSSKPKANPSDPLSAAFAKNQPEIEACFRDKAAGTIGNPEMSVRFTIDKEGVVQRAELTPAELASVPLGQCILGVAKRTRFPAQQTPSATFRIPLRARKSG